MALEKVVEYFEKNGLKDRVLIFNESSATVELAAKAVGCEPARIAKTLSFMVGENPILIVVAGDAKVNNSKYKQEFDTKAKMLDFDSVESLIGHAVGGVCPFAIKQNVKVYLDESLKRFDYVYPAAGSSNSAIKLTLSELEKYAENFVKWVDVAALREEE